MFDPRSRMFPIQRESDEISAFKEVLRALKNLKESFKEFKTGAYRPHAPIDAVPTRKTSLWLEHD